MSWDKLRQIVDSELESINVDSSIKFSNTPLEQRTDRPVLVVDDTISLSRQIEDFSGQELEILKWEAVSDILAYEAGLSSPGTFSQSDWDEFSILYDQIEIAEIHDFAPGHHDVQKRRNGSLLMRDRGEEMRKYSNELNDKLVESDEEIYNVLDKVFGQDDRIFESEPPLEYRYLMDMIVDKERRRSSYQNIKDKTKSLMTHNSTTDEGKEILEEFYHSIDNLESAEDLEREAISEAQSKIIEEYTDLISGADEKLMAASLLYLSASFEGYDDTLSAQRARPGSLAVRDYVTNSTLEQTEYLRDIAISKYFDEGMEMNRAFSSAVGEFLYSN